MMKRLPLFLLLPFVAVLGAACAELGSDDAIKATRLGTGYNSATQRVTGATSVFSPTDTVHCVIEVEGAEEGSIVRIVWTAVKVTDSLGRAIENQRIDEVELTLDEEYGVLDATLEPFNPWPIGEYEVEVYLDDNLERTLRFSVAE
jgi:hypothetical protein